MPRKSDVMACEYCHGEGYHLTQCPNFVPPKSAHYCSICNYPILNGEEYIENDFGEYAHWDCFSGTKDLLEFLGYRIRIMEDE